MILDFFTAAWPWVSFGFSLGLFCMVFSSTTTHSHEGLLRTRKMALCMMVVVCSTVYFDLLAMNTTTVITLLLLCSTIYKTQKAG